MKALGLKSEWARSTQKRKFENDMIIKAICSYRNLSFHLATVTSIPKERIVRIIGPYESHLMTWKSLFIDGINNYKRIHRSSLTPEELKEISEIEDGIPLYWIMAESYAIMAICIEDFLMDHGKISIEESEKFWGRPP